MSDRQLSVERWQQIQVEVRNLCNHLAGTELDHWRRDSLRHLVSDIDEVLARLPRQPIQLADHHKSLAAWLETAKVLTDQQEAA